MLHPDEANAVAERFGVAHSQVRRDHLISPARGDQHPRCRRGDLLRRHRICSRTIAPHGRLSEDIDLIALGRRRDTAEKLEPAYCARRAGSSPAGAGNRP
jgi:hypothetical protein